MRESECVKCRKVLDAATGINGGIIPTPGDISVCIYCGNIMLFDQDMKLRSPTATEMADAERNPLIRRLMIAIEGKNAQRI